MLDKKLKKGRREEGRCEKGKIRKEWNEKEKAEEILKYRVKKILNTGSQALQMYCSREI